MDETVGSTADMGMAMPMDTEAKAKDVSESRKRLVSGLTDTIREARRFWQPVFERMREDIAFAGGDQWHDAEDKMSDKYQVNFVQRALNQQVATIYAKNPTVTCERRPRLEYTVWDGSEAQLKDAKARIEQAAMQDFQAGQAGAPLGGPPKDASAIVLDYQNGAQRKRMYDRIAETAELLFSLEMDQQTPNFETEMKNLVLREKTTGAGFVVVKFRSENESMPTSSATAAGVIERLNRIHGLAAKLNDDQAQQPDAAGKEQLRLELAALQQALQEGEGKVSDQGLVFDFKPTTAVIVDPKCRNLVEFVGADWVAEEFLLSPEQVREQWGVDVTKGQGTVQYMHGVESKDTVNLRTKAGGEEKERNLDPGPWPEKAQVCVWIIHHKRDQMQYVVCDGYDDFLEEPEAPWPSVKGFWHILSLKLTRLEVEENKPQQGITIYGQSVARLLRPMQEEMNRSQEALREHRVANRPGHICGKDTFSTGDRKNLAGREAHAVIPLDNVAPGADCSKALTPIPVVPITPTLYATDHLMQHAMLVSGQQQANMGEQASGELATGQAIAEQSRVQSVSSEVDNQDKFLSNLARIGGEMLMLGMSAEVVKSKVGPGAVWPDSVQNREEIREMLYLRVDAGSSGRPNRALEIANLQALLPQLKELAAVMGLPLDPLVKYAARVMDFDFDIDEWLGQAQKTEGAGGAGQRGASEAISIKLADLTPDERAQALALAGIKATPGASSQQQPLTAQNVGAGGASSVERGAPEQAGPAGAGNAPAIPSQAMRMLPGKQPLNR